MNIRGNSVTKATGDTGDSEIKNKVSLPSNQHFPQTLMNIRGNSVTKAQETQETQKLKTGLIALKSTFPTNSHLNIRGNSVTKATGDTGDSEIKNKVSLPSNQHFPQTLI